MRCFPFTRSILILVLGLTVVGCAGDDSKAARTRRVTAHALVWNGRDGLPPNATPHDVPMIFVFDGPVDCSELLSRFISREDAPAHGVTVELVALAQPWVAGAGAKLRGARFYENGREQSRDWEGRHPSFATPDDAVTIVTAPTKNGTRAKLRVDTQITFSREVAGCDSDEDDHFLDVTGDVDAEVCGDIQ